MTAEAAPATICSRGGAYAGLAKRCVASAPAQPPEGHDEAPDAYEDRERSRHEAPSGDPLRAQSRCEQRTEGAHRDAEGDSLTGVRAQVPYEETYVTRV